MTNDPDFEPATESPTATILHELQLYGFRPFEDEPDPRPLPEGHRVTGALTYGANTSTDRMVADARTQWNNSLEALRTTLQMQGQVHG